MELSKARDLGLFRFEVNITEFFEGSDEELKVILGEPSMKDFDAIGKKENPTIDDYSRLFKTYMVDHSFTSNGNKAKNEEVVKLFIEMPELFVEITEQWFKECPLAKRNSSKSDNSVPSDSTK
jgi:hypothetical protein